MNNPSVYINVIRRADVQKAFYSSDNGHKQFLDREDLKVAMVEVLGYKPSKLETVDIMNKYGLMFPSQQMGLNMEQFEKAMALRLAADDEEDWIRQVFLAFDTHCHGFLTCDDLKRAVTKVAPHLLVHVLEAAFRELDQDGDSRVSYRDFEYMMKYDTVAHL